MVKMMTMERMKTMAKMTTVKMIKMGTVELKCKACFSKLYISDLESKKVSMTK